jgi:hypothetical protein
LTTKGGIIRPITWEEKMKLSPMLCVSVVALATLAMSAEGAFATDSVQSTSKGNVKANGMTTAPNHGGPAHSSGGPKHQGQSTTVNTSRSNIKNN